MVNPIPFYTFDLCQCIDWQHFTPWTSLAGGILLGSASALFILVNGRILGIGGIVGGLLRPASGDTGWRISFLLGLLTAPLVYAAVATPIAPRIDAGWAVVVAAGLLVGVGTRYGSGCTSGHGPRPGGSLGSIARPGDAGMIVFELAEARGRRAGAAA